MKKVDMKNNLTASVVLATYNGEEFLAQQIESILNQTVLPNEIIFVDDCSKDSTRLIIYDFIEIIRVKGIESKIVNHDVNIGYIENFFSGIELASKELIFLSDQDDLWESNKIEKCKDYFEKNLDMLALHTNTNIIDRDNNLIERNFQEYNKVIEKIEVKKFVKKVNYAGMSLVFKNGMFKDRLLEIKKSTSLNTHDWFICLVASINDGFFVSSDVLTLRRYTGENVALKLGNQNTNEFELRKQGISLYLEYYEILKDVIEKNYNRDIIDVSRYKKSGENRLEYIREKSYIKYIKNIININYYPSKKAYLKDGMILLKGTILNRVQRSE